MLVKKMITPDQNVRVYTAPLNATSGGGMEFTMTRQEARNFLHQETLEQSRERNISYVEARKHVLGANTKLKEYAFGGVVRREPTQQEGASGHLAEMIRMNIKTKGYTRKQAIGKALAEEGHGLRSRRAGFPLPTADGLSPEQREESDRMSLFYNKERMPDDVLKRYAGPGVLSTSHNEALRTAREVLPRQVAASVMHRGASQPGQPERDWLDHWFGVLVPAPSPEAGGMNRQPLLDYNAAREKFLADMIEEARQLLRDPAERAKLRPTPLGG